MKNLIILIGLTMLLSCNTESKHEYCKKIIENSLSIPIPNQFKLINYNSDFSIGDYSEQFELKFSKKIFMQILNSVNTEKYDNNIYFCNIKDDENERITIIFNVSKNTIKYTYYSE